MTAALVDVLLATYNGARYLQAQLDSIVAQTHPSWRILVSDDGSSDGTLEILQQYRDRLGDRLVLVPHPSAGRGAVSNFGNLMQASLDDGLAQWAVFADQDDVWLPQKIAELLAEMVRIEGADAQALPCLVHSDLTVVDENLQVLAPSFVQYQKMDPRDCSQLSLLSVNQVTGCTMMVNRALLRTALPLPVDTIMHDWWCALVSGCGRRSFIPAPLILYRQHGANQLGAKNRGLSMRLRRMVTDGPGVVRRVRELGRATRLQSEAWQARLQERQLGDGAYVSKYLAWRSGPLWSRITQYRHYYFGPELDRLSRCLLWY